MESNTLTIEKIVNGGYGLARTHSGQVVLLHNALPGETVRYHITDKRRGTLFGRAEPLHDKYAGRIPPPCPYYGKCGGCNLQHCNYDEQLNIKTKIIAEIFHGVFGNIKSCVSSPEQFGYRQRIRLQVREGNVGFLRFRSAEIVPITACLLAQPKINETLGYLLKKGSFHDLCENSREIELLYNPMTDAVILLFHFRRQPRPAERTLAITLAESISEVERIFFTGSDFSLKGPYPDTGEQNGARSLSYRYENSGARAPFELSWEVGGFCQVNLRQNENLISQVLQLCHDMKGAKILDLCCGMGNFSIPLGQTAGSVTGVEGQGAAIRAARQNSAEAGLTGTRFIKGAIASVCNKLVLEKQQFDITLLDPPRQGAMGLAADLAKLTVRRMLYISCDPATLVRDIKELQQHDFQLTFVQPFDMFPQTHHIETIAVLEKN